MQRQPDPAWVRLLAILMFSGLLIYAFIWRGLIAICTMHFDSTIAGLRYVKSGWSAVGLGLKLVLFPLVVIGALVYANRSLSDEN